jgi:hypothetical protein
MRMSLIAFVGMCWIGISAAAAEEPSLAKPLEALRPFLKTWKGHFKNSTPEKPRYDVQTWERALNGQAIRILHSVNEGAYGGETIITFNSKANQLEFHYFTTAGFTTRGTAAIEGRKLITHEVVTGSAGGVSEVKATIELAPDGKMRLKSQHLKDGNWTDAREMTYEEAPGAKVVFR